MSITDARKAAVAQIASDFPDISLFEGFPPQGFHHAVRTYCFVYPIGETQEQSRTLLRCNIGVAVMLPYIERKDDEPYNLVDPEGIESLADQIKDSLKNIQTGSGYIAFRLVSTDFPGDPSGQKTRVVMTFQTTIESLYY